MYPINWKKYVSSITDFINIWNKFAIDKFVVNIADHFPLIKVLEKQA